MHIARRAHRVFIHVLACLVILAAPSSLRAGDPANWAAVGLYRTDPVTIGVPWAGTVILDLAFVNGVTGVDVELPSGLVVALDDDADSAEWAATVVFVSMNDMLTQTHGTWTITISGSEPSETEFTLTVNGLTDTDFFDYPTITTPAVGSVVPRTTPIIWTDPTGAATAENLAVEINSDTESHGVDALSGEITVESTSWMPPLLEANAFHTGGVFYVRYASAAMVSPYTVVSGGIIWNEASGIPEDYPANSPRVTFGGANVTSFFTNDEVGVTGDITGDGMVGIDDLLVLLGSWGPCPGCPADLDGDGAVTISDFLIVLGAWT